MHLLRALKPLQRLNHILNFRTEINLMKIIAFLSIPFLCVAAFLLKPTPEFEKSSASTAAELTDKKDITFARTLRDYKNHRVDSLTMDIYYPTGATSDKKYPLLMFYHAGGFMAGNRFNVMTICDRFADEGFIAVAIDYRTGYDKGKGHNCLSDSVTFNNATYRAAQDANSAIRFLVANAAQYNIDTSWIFVAGSSAGASLSLYQAYVNDSIARIYYPIPYNSLGGVQSTGNTLTNTFTIKGICSMWGALGHAPEIISTKYRAIPTILFKGEEDGGIPDSAGHYDDCLNMPYVYAGIAIYDELRAVNKPAVFHYLPLAGHPAFDNGFCVQNASCFFHSLMQGNSYSGQFTNFNISCP